MSCSIYKASASTTPLATDSAGNISCCAWVSAIHSQCIHAVKLEANVRYRHVTMVLYNNYWLVLYYILTAFTVMSCMEELPCYDHKDKHMQHWQTANLHGDFMLCPECYITVHNYSAYDLLQLWTVIETYNCSSASLIYNSAQRPSSLIWR